MSFTMRFTEFEANSCFFVKYDKINLA